MNHHDSEDLLNEILTTGDESDFRRQTLARGIAALRQRTRRRRLVRASALAAIPCLLAIGLSIIRSRDHAANIAANQISSPHVIPLPPVKIINDEQLFALFPDRAMALVGKRGNQQLVFLDRKDPSKAN
jgi:hypothetical protein